MTSYRNRSVFLSSLLSLIFCITANAQIISTVPPKPEKQSIDPPQGFVRCDMSPSGFSNAPWIDVDDCRSDYTNCYVKPSGNSVGPWINSHQICQYGNGNIWISGYWQCMKYTSKGICQRWSWVSSHWLSPQAAEYGAPNPVIQSGPGFHLN